MSDEFGKPSTASGITWADLKERLVLVKVHAVETGIKTVHGDSNAIRADVVVLDGDVENIWAEYNDTLIFPKVLQSQLKGSVGGMVLGRVGQGQAKPGQSAPWTLSEATDADKTIARAYLAAKNPAPF